MTSPDCSHAVWNAQARVSLRGGKAAGQPRWPRAHLNEVERIGYLALAHNVVAIVVGLGRHASRQGRPLPIGEGGEDIDGLEELLVPSHVVLGEGAAESAAVQRPDATCLGARDGRSARRTVEQREFAEERAAVVARDLRVPRCAQVRLTGARRVCGEPPSPRLEVHLLPARAARTLNSPLSTMYRQSPSSPSLMRSVSASTSLGYICCTRSASVTGSRVENTVAFVSVSTRIWLT